MVGSNRACLAPLVHAAGWAKGIENRRSKKNQSRCWRLWFTASWTESVSDLAYDSRICFFTFAGTSAYFSGSMALAARPVDMERSSVV